MLQEKKTAYTLPELELYYRKLDLYFSFCKAFSCPVDSDALREEREKTADLINMILLHNLKNKHQIEMDAVEKESLKKLNDAKLNFYTTITHELRTPVFLISAQLEELLNAHKSIVPVPSTFLRSPCLS